MTLAARVLLLPCIAGLAIGCRSPVSSAQGEWARINPETSIPMGDVLKIEGNTWHLTGNPPMSGTVKATGGKVQLVLEKIGDQTREEALKTPGVQDMDKTLKDLDDQLVFEIREVEGKTRLFQAGKSGRFVEWRFELKPRP